jgi:hypothetical protein
VRNGTSDHVGGRSAVVKLDDRTPPFFVWVFQNVFHTWITLDQMQRGEEVKAPRLRGFSRSPLTDSNRRPPPYQVSGRYGVRSLQPEAVATGRLTPYLRSMESDGAGPDLTDDLDYWEIPLKSGEIVNLRAHGVKDRGMLTSSRL